MNIPFWLSQVLQYVGAVSIVVFIIRFIYAYRRANQKLNRWVRHLERIEEHVDELQDKVGYKSYLDHTGGGILGDVEKLQDQMKEIAEKVAKIQVS